MDGHEELAIKIAGQIRTAEGKSDYLVNEVLLLSQILQELKLITQKESFDNAILEELKLLRKQQEEAAFDMSRELREIKVRLMDSQR